MGDQSDIPGELLGNLLSLSFEGEKVLGRTESVEIIGRVFSEEEQIFSDFDSQFDRVWICLRGYLKLMVEGQPVELEEGDMYRVPKQTTHGNVNADAETRVLIVRGTFS